MLLYIPILQQVTDGQPLDLQTLDRRLAWEAVRADVEFVTEAEQRTRDADDGIQPAASG